MRKRNSDHRTPQAGGARVIFGATRATDLRAYRVAAARSHGALHSTPNQHAPADILASIRADPTLLEAVEQVTAGVHSGIAHGARAGTLTFPKICRLAAGWLSEGADTCAARCSAPLFTCIAPPFAPLSLWFCRALLLLDSSPSLP